MKKSILSISFIFLLASCTTTHMAKLDKVPNRISQPDKATLVIIRNILFDDGYVFWIYLDRNLIGETMEKTYFVTSVTPGIHYLVVVAENKSVARFDFKAGKTYFLAEWGMIGVWRSRTAGLYPMTPDDAAKAMKKCSYLEYDPKTGQELIDPKLYQQAIDEYHKDIKKYPDVFKDILKYDGVEMK